MNLTTTISRVLLGLPFLIFGINYFFPFVPHPELSGNAIDYMTGLTKTGYFWPILRGLEIIIGIALISNRFVPLALAVLLPISFQILVFHIFLEPQNIPMALTIFVLHVFLIYRYWDYFKSLIAVKAEILQKVK